MTTTDVATVDQAHSVAPAVPGALVAPVSSLAAIRSNFQAYQELCANLLVADDYQQIRKKSFKKKSAYRKLAVAFGVSCEIIDRQYERDGEGSITRAEFVVRAVAPNGRYMDGWGACDITESRFEKEEGKQKPGHDIPATAETRAKNRACSDLFGMGEVSAEEVSVGGYDRPVDYDEFYGWLGWDSRAQHDEVRDEIVAVLRQTNATMQKTVKAWREAAGIDLRLLSKAQAVVIDQKLVELGIVAVEEEATPPVDEGPDLDEHPAD